MPRNFVSSFFLLLVICALGFSQQDPAREQTGPVEPMNPTPVYRVNVVSRSTKAVNYRHHSGKTQLDFRGTDLMPQASGHATVESRTGRVEINSDFDQLQPSRIFGPEYLTYVLWAITPEGRPSNLGEIVPKDGKSSIKVSTDLQAFGLIVTAEPYFAVTRPSNVVVVENIVRPNTKGREQPIDAKFDLLERGQYTVDTSPAQLPATNAAPNTPTDLLEARNAVAIARAEGGERYAPDALHKAEDFLNLAEDYLRRQQSEKVIATAARGAVQSAEDARVLSIRKRQEEQQEAERRASEQRETQARSAAEQAQQAEATARGRAEELAQQGAQAEQERQAAEWAKAEAERARQEADASRAAAIAQQQTAQAQARQAQLAAQQAEQARWQTEQEAQQTRERLLRQLNDVLQTKETARGLIVNIPDVLFDSGQYTLKPSARERLAKVAGILLVYLNLHVQVEGHTDNVGGVGYNQQLSEQRASAVREFLTRQGVNPVNIESRGFGMSQPVASNSTATSRQLNRRVDLVVTGEAIGTSAGGISQQAPVGTQSTMPGQTPPPNLPAGRNANPVPSRPSPTTPNNEIDNNSQPPPQQE